MADEVKNTKPATPAKAAAAETPATPALPEGAIRTRRGNIVQNGTEISQALARESRS